MPKTGLFLEDDLADFRKLLLMMSGDSQGFRQHAVTVCIICEGRQQGAHNRLRWSAAGRTDQARSGMERNYVSG